MITILQVISNHLPYLDMTIANVIANVNAIILETKYALQIPLNKTDLQVEDEANYGAQERILVGLYSAYTLVLKKGVTNLFGDVTTGEQPNQAVKSLKKAVADVVEAEFDVKVLKSGETNFAQTSESYLATLKQEICQQATLLEIWLPICSHNERDVVVPFRVIC